MIPVLFISFIVLLMIGIPVAFSLGASSLIYFMLTDLQLNMVAQRFFAGMDSFTILCIPGFVLAGNLMNVGGITVRIIDFAKSFIGHWTGGLAQANILASMVFAGISGTALADTVSLGGVLIPAMVKEGYDAEFSVAITAASSTIGPIIPPSLPMIMAATMTGLSVSKMFIAGAVPGILIGVALMIASYFFSKKNNYPKDPKATWGEKWESFKFAFWAILMTLLILVCIIGGIVTPTEVSILAVVYALAISLFVYKELRIKDIPQVIRNSCVTASSIMILVAFANVFAWIMAKEQIPQMIADGMLGITTNKIIILLLINVLLLFVGCFMETIAAIIILFPVLLNVATSVGVEPIQFGVIVVLNLVIGLCTPPVGVCLFAGASIGKISLSKASKAILPFVGVELLVLMLVTYVPAITMWPVSLFFPA